MAGHLCECWLHLPQLTAYDLLLLYHEKTNMIFVFFTCNLTYMLQTDESRFALVKRVEINHS